MPAKKPMGLAHAIAEANATVVPATTPSMFRVRVSGFEAVRPRRVMEVEFAIFFVVLVFM